MDRDGCTRVLIARHAESTFNAEHRYQGRHDEAVLTEKGLETARRLGQRLASEAPELIVTSPLRRARQTAELAAEALGLPAPIEDARLMEIDLPQWEGLSIDTVQREYAEGYRVWQQQPEQLSMPRAGSSFYPLRELFAQAEAFWGACLARHAGRTVLLVTHAGTARALLSTALGVLPSHFNCLEQANGALSVVEFAAESRRGVVESMNLTAHLGRVVPKLKAGKSGVRLVLLARGGEPEMRVDVRLEGVPAGSVVSAVREAREKSAREGALHAVWRGTADEIREVAAARLGIEPGRAWWKDPGDAVVHFPGDGRRAVVQALNPLSRGLTLPSKAW